MIDALWTCPPARTIGPHGTQHAPLSLVQRWRDRWRGSPPGHPAPPPAGSRLHHRFFLTIASAVIPMSPVARTMAPTGPPTRPIPGSPFRENFRKLWRLCISIDEISCRPKNEKEISKVGRYRHRAAEGLRPSSVEKNWSCTIRIVNLTKLWLSRVATTHSLARCQLLTRNWSKYVWGVYHRRCYRQSVVQKVGQWNKRNTKERTVQQLSRPVLVHSMILFFGRAVVLQAGRRVYESASSEPIVSCRWMLVHIFVRYARILSLVWAESGAQSSSGATRSSWSSSRAPLVAGALARGGRPVVSRTEDWFSSREGWSKLSSK